MGTTTKFAIPYVEPSDLLANYPAADKASKEQIEAAILGPSSWTTLPASSAGSIRYRLVGGMVVVDVSMPLTTTAGTIYTISASPLPSGWRPVGMTARGFADFSGFPGGINVDANGVVTARHNSGANRSNIAGQVFYPPN